MGNPVFRKDLERGFRVWHIKEIFTGEVGVTSGSLYVPNVGDLVVDNSGIIYRVTAVDETNAIPTLEIIAGGPSKPITDPDSLPDGLRTYQPSGINRLFIDNSTNPHSASVYSQFRVYGSENTQAKLFRGRDTSPAGVVLSHTINSSNVIVSEMIDLIPLYATNNTIKRPARFHTSHELDDGEVATLVTYSASGRVTGEYVFLIRNANMISGPTASNVYIEDIEIISDLISDHDPLLIENPLHVPFNTTMLTCRVWYSDGTYADHTIDGNKAKLHGVNSFNTGLLGPSSKVVLSYYPSPSEPAINLQGSIAPSISKTYNLANIPLYGDTAYKLYAIPIWTGSGYRLAFRLTDLEYLTDIDVTESVMVTRSDGTPFRGNDYDRVQSVRAAVSLDLLNNPQAQGTVHVQEFKITLNPPGTVSQNNYVIDYIGDGFTYFGVGHYCTASLSSSRKFKIDINQSNQADWLSWLYRAVDPMYNNSVVDRAPEPTHFRLEQGGVNGGRLVGTYNVSQWDEEFELGTERSWEQNYPLNIVWIVRENGLDKTVAMTPLSIKYVYSGS